MPHPLTPNTRFFLSFFFPPTQLWDRGTARAQLPSRVSVLFRVTLLPSSVNMQACSSNIWDRKGFGITDLSSKCGKGGKHEMGVNLALSAK